MTLCTKIEIQNDCYSSNSNIINVNLNNVAFVDNNATYAFYNCFNVVNVYNVNPDVSLCTSMFYDCRRLSTVTFASPPSGKNTTGCYAMFYNVTNPSFTLPQGFTNLRPKNLSWTFSKCSLNNVNLADMNCNALAEMYRAFYYCTNLKSVNMQIADTPTLNMSQAFNNCSNLQTVNLSLNNVPSCNAAYLFWNCPNLQTLNFAINNVQNANFEHAFYNCQKLTTPPVITNSTATSLSNAFYNCRNLSATSNFQDFYNIFAGATNMCGTFTNCVNANFANVTIPNTVTNLLACFVNTKIKKIYIPKTDNEVYISQFVDNCPSLTDVTGYLYAKNFVGGVNSGRQFGNRMDNVVNFTVNLGNSMTDISHAFAGRDYGSYGVYGFFKLQHGPLSFGGAVNMCNTFRNCQNLISVGNIPNTVTNMRTCFWRCHNFTQIGDTVGVIANLPDSVINVYGAFSDCFLLPQFPFPGNSATDMSWTFSNCYTPTSYNYYVPVSVINMHNTFLGCTNLTGDIRIKSTKISNAINCFYNTTKPKNVYIPFKYANGVYTQTYNTFNAIYGTGANGVTLLNYTELYE